MLLKLKRFGKSALSEIVAPFAACLYRSRIAEVKRQSQKVLLVANNELMFEYVNAVWDAYHDKDEYSLYLCSTETLTLNQPKRLIYRRMKALAASKDLMLWPDYIASRVQWDLLITAEPDVPVELCAASRRSVLIQHALIGIKTIDGWLYPYHPQRCFYKNGECKFNAIFENTSHAFQKVLRNDQRYKGVIKLAGSIAADTLLELNQERAEIRANLGYNENDYVVLLQSTFRESLIEDLGMKLLEECQRISEETGWRFIISLHPNHWAGEYADKHPWGRTTLDYESDLISVRRPHEDASLSLIACDIAVTDHTSLSYNYMLLNKPALFYLPPNGNQVMEVMGEIIACCTTFEQPSELYVKLQEAKQVFDRNNVERLLAEMFPYLGKAKERNDEILDVLLGRA